MDQNVSLVTLTVPDLNASAMAAGRTTVTPKTVNNEGAVVIEEKAQEHVAYY